MGDRNIQLFDNERIRNVWDGKKQNWYFSVVDICAVLIDSEYQTARRYWNKLKPRLKYTECDLAVNCRQMKMRAPDGRMRWTDVADALQVLRMLQFMPSIKVPKH